MLDDGHVVMCCMKKALERAFALLKGDYKYFQARKQVNSILLLELNLNFRDGWSIFPA